MSTEYIYEDEISKLLSFKPTLVPKSSIFNFYETPYEDLFHRYYNFCMENIRNHTSSFDIKESNIVFIDDININAKAGRPYDYSLILINKGVLLELKNFFCIDCYFEKANVAIQYKNLQEVIDVEISELMLQYSSMFTYFHELGHIIQKSELIESFLSETNSLMDPHNEEILRRHILEVDADWFAANKIAQHIIDYWERLKEKMPKLSIRVLYDLIKISFASIQCYLAFGFGSFIEEIYYIERTHPHACVRLTIILSIVSDILEKNLQFKSQELLNDTIELSNQILHHKSYIKLLDDWKEKLEPEQGRIFEYAQLLVSKFPEYPNLASHKLTK